MEASLSGFETAVQRVVLEAAPATVNLIVAPSRLTESVVVTARRVEEAAQDVPIPMSVLKGDVVADAGAFNVNRMKEMLPTVQFYSTNPRNSSINIRGLGSSFGLTNDGIEQGVGAVYRRRVLRSTRLGIARFPRRRSRRSAARAAGHFVREEHDGRRHQCHDTQAEFQADGRG